MSASTTPSLTSFSLLLFDCYGTIVDWESGIATALAPLVETSTLSPRVTRQALLSLYGAHEKAAQSAHPTLPYSSLLAGVYLSLASALKCEPAPSAEASTAFGDSIGTWPAFGDSVDALQRLGRRYKLVPLSNVDRKSLDATVQGPLEGKVRFDARYTAQDVGSYKPDIRNFEYAIEKARADFGIEKDKVLMVAQSLFHDHVQAKKVGLKSCWVMRAGDDASMGGSLAELGDSVDLGWKVKDLGELADLVEKAFGELEGGK